MPDPIDPRAAELHALADALSATSDERVADVLIAAGEEVVGGMHDRNEAVRGTAAVQFYEAAAKFLRAAALHIHDERHVQLITGAELMDRLAAEAAGGPSAPPPSRLN